MKWDERHLFKKIFLECLKLYNSWCIVYFFVLVNKGLVRLLICLASSAKPIILCLSTVIIIDYVFNETRKKDSFNYSYVYIFFLALDVNPNATMPFIAFDLIRYWL